MTFRLIGTINLIPLHLEFDCAHYMTAPIVRQQVSSAAARIKEASFAQRLSGTAALLASPQHLGAVGLQLFTADARNAF